MDRSFLSNAKVIEASRDWVCIRLATYEDAAEAEFLKQIYLGRTGNLENTVFALLSPEGTKPLCRPGRGPNFAFRDARTLAESLEILGATFEDKETAKDYQQRLPQSKDFRLSLNVASCDGIPIVVGFHQTKDEEAAIKKLLTSVAFDSDLAGKFAYSSTSSAAEMKIIDDFITSPGVYVVSPGNYGLSGRLAKRLPVSTSTKDLKDELVKFAASYKRPNKDHRQHVDQGYKSGKGWETEIPVTDEMSNRAKERLKDRAKRR